MRLVQRIKSLLGVSSVRHSSHVLVAQINQSLRLQPVSMMSQVIGVAGILGYFWHTLNRPLLIVWACVVVLSQWGWLEFHRRFNNDSEREQNIRQWIRNWMYVTIASGLIWGGASVVFALTTTPIDQVFLVAIIVAVVFASWPAFSCWLPSLTTFTLLALTPMVFGVASIYEIKSVVIASILLVVTAFVLYSGRRLNEIVVMAVTRNEQNERLVVRLKAEKAMAESARRATAQASERRARFFAGANHDLRQPLQAMGIYLQILKMQASGNTGEIVAQIETAAQNISTLVEQLLEVSRIEMGSIDVKIEPIEVPELFASLHREFWALAGEKQLTLEIRPLQAQIQSDPLLIRRILRNLISNALRYSDKKGGRIILAARRKSFGRLSIGVYDQGPGISEQDRGRIFEAFYRGEEGRKNAGGFGLGLSIVVGLAQRLSIPLSMGSRPGRGSVFRLELMEYFPEQAQRSDAGAFPLASDLDVRGVVGLLEDNRIVGDAVAAMLKSWGATVIQEQRPTTQFVDQLVEQANRGNLSAFISDHNLGEGEPSGLETIFQVRSATARPVPCVLLTAVSEEELRTAFRQICLNPDNAGQPMPVILQKPASAQALASALRRAIAERQGTLRG